ncbi:MAG: DUF4177 domain-containing protein [Clostridia bacterium]|nr:DUF4177 domain-containing protein [Clostridia bacterium]
MLEYKVKIITDWHFKTEKAEAKYEEEMNALAREGWRVVAVTSLANSMSLLITFERETSGPSSF